MSLLDLGSHFVEMIIGRRHIDENWLNEWKVEIITQGTFKVKQSTRQQIIMFAIKFSF